MLLEPLHPVRARALIRVLLGAGQISFSKHSEDEMRQDRLTRDDVINMLRGGTVDPAEYEFGSWRYRVRTARMAVVVAFRSESELRVVTAWRVQR